MGGMFEESRAFNQLIDKWDVSKVTDMHNMFRDSKVFNQPIDRWGCIECYKHEKYVSWKSI